MKKGQGEGGRLEMLSCIDNEGIYYGGFRCYAVDSKVQDESMTGGDEADRVSTTLSAQRNTSGTTTSRRAKFIFFAMIGENAPAMAKGRVTTHLNDVKKAFKVRSDRSRYWNIHQTGSPHDVCPRCLVAGAPLLRPA